MVWSQPRESTSMYADISDAYPGFMLNI